MGRNSKQYSVHQKQKKVYLVYDHDSDASIRTSKCAIFPIDLQETKKIAPLKPCSHRASALKRALMLFNPSRTHLNFDTSVDTAPKCEGDAIETNVESIPFKRQR